MGCKRRLGWRPRWGRGRHPALPTRSPLLQVSPCDAASWHLASPPSITLTSSAPHTLPTHTTQHPGSHVGAQPRRPAGRSHRAPLEDRRGGRGGHRAGLDAAVCRRRVLRRVAQAAPHTHARPPACPPLPAAAAGGGLERGGEPSRERVRRARARQGRPQGAPLTSSSSSSSSSSI